MSPNAPFLAPERDSAFKRGRGVGSVTYLGIPGCSLTGTSTLLPGGTIFYAPFYVDTPILIDQLLAEVTVLESGKNMRIGIYSSDLTFQPTGAPLADSGDISLTTTGVKTYTPGTPLLLPRGRYLSAQNSDALGTATLRTFLMTGQMSMLSTTLGSSPVINRTNIAAAYAAFANPGPTWTSSSSTNTPMAHSVVFRISQP